MASNRSALDEAPYGSSGPVTGRSYGIAGPGAGTVPGTVPGTPHTGSGTGTTTRFGPDTGLVTAPYAFADDDHDDEPWEEWNPTADSIASVRGRHRVAKQRGGTMARSGAVLGVGVIAAVGAGGMASAKDRPAAPISMPDVAHFAGEVKASLPAAKDIPGVGGFLSDDSARPDDGAASTAPLAASGTAGAGEALRARILHQAEQQQVSADDATRESAVKAAADRAADAAARKAAEQQAEADKKAAEAAAKRKAAEAKAEAEAEAKRKADAERHTKLAAQFILPVSSYTLTASFGQAGDRWSADHTGQDFAAPTGTPVKAVSGGTITEAGWAGSYGYRIILTLDDGSEIWYCHLSSMVQTSGEVTTGEVIGRVGATGNVTGPHLHLEVRPGGADPIDPMGWLRDRGLTP